MAKRVFLIAGHSVNDPGAIAYDKTSEASLTRTLRDDIIKNIESRVKNINTVPVITYDGTVERDDDSYSLNQTINEINRLAKDGDQVIDIHFNHNAVGATGCEVFIYNRTNSDNKARAKELGQLVSDTLGIPFRGVKNDTETAVGSLGILRYTKCQAFLIEICFLNDIDLPKYRAHYSELVRELGGKIFSYRR